MKKLLFVALLSLPTVLAGCETLVDSPHENLNRMAQAQDTNGKELVDDVERHLLLDRPSWLTNKPIFMY